MIRPVLVSLVVVAGIGAAFLWRTTAVDPAPAAEQKDSPIEVGLSRAAPPAESEAAAAPAPSTSLPGERNHLAALKFLVLQREGNGPDSLARYRERLELEYEKAGKALALTPEEVKRIIDTLVRLRQDSDAALRELAGRDPAGRSRDDQLNEMHRLQRVAKQREDIEMMALLGSKYTQWQEFNLAPITLGSVKDLQTLMEMSDIRPLTPEQAASLASALNSERVRILRDSNADERSSPDAGYATGMQQVIEWEQRHTPESNRRLEVIASRLLDPQQLAIYRRMLEDTYNLRLRTLQGTLAAEEAAQRSSRSPP